MLTNHFGAATQLILPPFPFYNGNSSVSAIRLNHPGPLFSGLSFRVAAVGFESVLGQWAASQSEYLTLE